MGVMGREIKGRNGSGGGKGYGVQYRFVLECAFNGLLYSVL